MDLLSPLDAAWLFVESREAPMHVASLQIFSPPRGAPTDFVGRMVTDFKATRSVGPPWNKKLARSLINRVVPAWTPAPDIDLDYHVRHSALPRPGGERELGVLVSRLHSEPLDFARPLWECEFIEGLADGRYAVYTKMHHSLIDGISGMRLLQRALSTNAGDTEMPAPWAGRLREGDSALAGERSADTVTVSGLAAAVLEQVGAVGNVSAALARLVGAQFQRDATLVAPLTCPTSILNGRVTPQRRFARQTAGVEDLRALARTANCTLNDLVLWICATALRRFLAESRALPTAALTAGLPVNVRPADDWHTGTAISFICANLATDIDDPLKRLNAIAASTASAKQHLQQLPRAALTQYTIAFMAPYILEILSGMGGRMRPPFNITISNVPGPDHYLFLNGARLEAMYPMSLLSHGQALNITCLSYAGTLNFGFTGCRDTLPHMQRLAVYAGEALEELKDLLESRSAPEPVAAPD